MFRIHNPHPRRTRLSSGALLLGAALALLPLAAFAGPYTDAGHATTEMVAWGTAVDEIIRGPENIVAPAGPLASAGLAANTLGPATGVSTDTVSLGDGGSITLFLESGISNGPGNDFAVFENGFFDLFGLFAEFAFVEVASNGVDFAAFEVDTVNAFPVSAFGTLDPTDYHGLAGRHAVPLGTGFDLADLAADPLVAAGTLDLMDVRFVRLTDIVGDGSTVDADGEPLYDPYATAFAAGGFDLEAIGVRYVPEPGTLALLGFGAFALVVAAQRRRALSGCLAAGALLFAANPALALVSTFEDLGLPAESRENGSGLGGGDLVSDGVTYENDYFSSFDGFGGFAGSTMTDTTTPGFTNQYSAFPGSGVGGSSAYGIFFNSTNRVVLPSEGTVEGAYFTNTTYAALSMLNGDAFAKQFGGATGLDPDFFRLIIEGFDDGGNSTGTVDFLLADYTAPGTANDYIVDAWEWVDLTGLGNVRELAFSFESSDVGGFGINTPTYFAIDDLTFVPEPGTALLLGLGLLGLGRSGRAREARR